MRRWQAHAIYCLHFWGDQFPFLFYLIKNNQQLLAIIQASTANLLLVIDTLILDDYADNFSKFRVSYLCTYAL